MNKNTQAIIWVAAAFVAIAAGGWVYKLQFSHTKAAGQIYRTIKLADPITKNVASITAPPIVSTTSTSTSTIISNPAPIYKRKKPSPATTLSYGDVVTKYANTRIQFNQNCQAIPGQTVMANPATVMLDNRSDQTQKITIAGHSYSVSAFNYVLVTLNEKNLPQTLHVDCNNQMNSLQIVLE